MMPEMCWPEWMRRVGVWMIDTAFASYYAMTIKQKNKQGRLSDDPVVVNTRGGEHWYQRSEGYGRFAAFELRYDDLNEDEKAWRHPDFETAQSVADGFNRSLSARRRTVLFVFGIPLSLIPHLILRCLL